MVYLNVDKCFDIKDEGYNMTWSIATGKGIVSENFSIPSSCLVIQMDCFILYHLVSAKQCKQFCQTMQICKMRLCSAPSDYSSYHCHQHHNWQTAFVYINLPNTVIFLSIGSLTKTAFPFPDIVSPEIYDILNLKLEYKEIVNLTIITTEKKRYWPFAPRNFRSVAILQESSSSGSPHLKKKLMKN